MTRQQWIDETAKTEDKDTAFLMRLAEKRVQAEEKTAKKRAKRFEMTTKSIILYVMCINKRLLTIIIMSTFVYIG